MGISGFLQPIASSLTYICVLVLATFAVTLIFKTSATTNFAQGSVAAFGCYWAASFLVVSGWSIWASLAAGVAFGILCGLFIDLVIFRNGKHVNLVGKQIITMGLVSVIANIIPMLFKFAMVTTPNIPPLSKAPLINLELFDGSSIVITPHSLVCVGITVAIIVILFLLLKFSKWGLGVRTTASNEYVAQMMGVNTYAITAISWGIAGGLGALAAVMFTGENGVMTGPYFMTDFQVNAFLAGILGGFGTFFGPIVCAIIIPLTKVLIDYLVYIDGFEIISKWDTTIVYVLVMIAIFIKPTGLFGKKMVKKV